MYRKYLPVEDLPEEFIRASREPITVQQLQQAAEMQDHLQRQFKRMWITGEELRKRCR